MTPAIEMSDRSVAGQDVVSGVSIECCKNDGGPLAEFRSLLLPPGYGESFRPYEPPACLVDLNLDIMIAAAVEYRDEAHLRPIFHKTYRDAEVVRYRQAVFADLLRPEIVGIFPPFTDDAAGPSES